MDLPLTKGVLYGTINTHRSTTLASQWDHFSSFAQFIEIIGPSPHHRCRVVIRSCGLGGSSFLDAANIGEAA